jgi:hypothetical protein
LKYHLFIDESGDHGLGNIDEDFPVFVLCGVILSEASYLKISAEIDQLKRMFWQEKKVIFHSRDIRKCDKEFQILLNLEIKKSFYDQLNKIIADGDYSIIASAIDKTKFIQEYGKLSDVYSVAFSFIIERAIFYMDEQPKPATIEITVEKRGRKEDDSLLKDYNEVYERGTYFVQSKRIKNYKPKFHFKAKKENLNGLQLADLLAYPIARYVIDKERANPSYEVFKNKFYGIEANQHGLKVFP